MADPQPLLLNSEAAALPRSPRVASVDVFRGLSVFLMIFVDYGGSIFPTISHSPWNGLHLADFVMPFFLFLVGISLALAYKRRPHRRTQATSKAFLRALQLFILGILLQGGYFHGITSLTYGVDIQTIRLFGILQRISIGYIVAALCQIWLPTFTSKHTAFFTTYYSHWFVAIILLATYSGLLYGLYVPDWQFNVSASTSSLPPIGGGDVYTECNMSSTGQVSDSSPSWCHAPFDPEGILSSLTAAVSCIIGLQYGHILAHLEDHKGRLYHWLGFSVSFLALGGFLALIGIPLNKSLYTVSYMLLSSAASGLTFMALYVLVDVYGHRRLTSVLEWMGKHSLSIFVLVSSNLAVIAIQGFYWTKPENNIVHWIVSRFHHK
ncbi:hypothetical protein TSUD_310530 [Trifolium subterraneum]|uniref:Heparan-alpha-glucosaminide N-acetyltransferase catalytic domain-containing protein n=1 Tax=Trifolium subterraneum TaxID=3900 RepID=A0A2Z6NC78_TRISU|nr:hypothetical protein TSUD_310530 [Trifolium subterraneum]